jgi:hypothetical protein
MRLVNAHDTRLQGMRERELDRLREIFWDGFGVPPLRTRRFRKVYYDWVEVEDMLAGPIYTVANGGDWDHVFVPGQPRIRGVTDIDSLLRWYFEPIGRFRRIVEGHHPPSGVGRADKRLLVRKIDTLEELGRLAASIATARRGDGAAR